MITKSCVLLWYVCVCVCACVCIWYMYGMRMAGYPELHYVARRVMRRFSVDSYNDSLAEVH